VKQKYGAAAKHAAAVEWHRAAAARNFSCCDPITKDLYDSSQIAACRRKPLPVPRLRKSHSLGAIATGRNRAGPGLRGGIDVLLSAKRVGPTGKAYGLDMTDEMLSLARENQQKSRGAQRRVLKRRDENIPLPDNSVDVIISNCRDQSFRG